MILLLWTTLLFSVRDQGVVQAALRETCSYNNPSYCITLEESVITAERGLCLEIPCSFKTSSYFTPRYLRWYKCQQEHETCVSSSDLDLNLIYSSEVKTEHKGRVSLLESDVSRGNCSIIINDLSRWDSGWYQLRVGGTTYSGNNAWLYLKKQRIDVKGLSSKPTLDVPPLKEGQLTRLTCTAPGLCSGSEPTISWKWEGKGKNLPLIGGNITDHQIVSHGALRRQHSSTLVFSASSEHHSSSISCTVVFKDGATSEERRTLEVEHLKSLNIVGEPLVREGETLSLSCAAESFPPALIKWTKGRTSESLANISGGALVITNVTEEHSGTYRCTAELGKKRLMKEVVVKVTWSDGILNGSRCERDSAALTCVCGSRGRPLPSISWPLQKNHSDYHLQTNVSGREIWSRFSVNDVRSVENVMCVASQESANTEQELTVHTLPTSLMSKPTFLTMEIFLALLVGVLLSATVFLLVQFICCRNKKKNGKDTEIPLTNGAENERAVGQGGAQDPDPGQMEVKYTAIDFTRFRGKNPRKATETTETEYSEIRRQDVTRTTAHDESEKIIVENRTLIGEKQVPDKEVAVQEMALYSNITEISLCTE